MLMELPDIALPKAAGDHLNSDNQEFDPALVDEAIIRWRSVGSDIESLLPTEPGSTPGSHQQNPQAAAAQMGQIPQPPMAQPTMAQPTAAQPTVAQPAAAQPTAAQPQAPVLQQRAAPQHAPQPLKTSLSQ
jgi:hypothetical protein